LEPIQSYADFVFVASGSNTRQTQTLADNIQKRVFEICKRHPLGVEGYQFGQWILVDYGDVICHIFLDETRQIYKLEDMWSEVTPMDEGDLEFYFTGKRPEKMAEPIAPVKKSTKPKVAIKKVAEKPKRVTRPVKKSAKTAAKKPVKATAKKATAKTKKPIKIVKKVKAAVKKPASKATVKKPAKAKPVSKKLKKVAVKKVTAKKTVAKAKAKKPSAKNKKIAKTAKRKK
jgi:ribosome-associated protein